MSPPADLRPLRVLLVEDSDDDAQLLIRYLRVGGYQPVTRRVQTGPAMATALAEEVWDLVLADNAMPGFSAQGALEVLKSSGRDIPFIIVSGLIGDTDAVAAMAAGAQDYVLKDNLVRLLPAIQRELREADVRQAGREAEAVLRFQAYHDPLTGLLNRREFEHRVGQALDTTLRAGERHVLGHLNVDQFKIINESCGHGAGDELLKQLAGLLQAQLRSSDVLARLGGDDFGLLLPCCNQEDAFRIAGKLRDAVQTFRFPWDGRQFQVGLSSGMVEINPASREVAELMSAADAACQTAKELGRNRIHLYQADDEQLARRRAQVQWVARITQALDQDRFVLHQQPIVALADAARGPGCREILVRMLDKDRSVVPPGAFIPAAERYKLMPSVDRWVFHALCRHLAQRPEDSDQVYFVNLSGASLHDEGFLDFVRREMEEHGIDGERICFEITESTAIANLSAALRFFSSLRAFGCRFALDDFGSGLSSFGYLKNLPVDFLKIDGSFIRDLTQDPIDRAMVEAIHNIGHVMKLKTVAEWVEDDATLAVLREIGVDYGQGYGIARPMLLE